MILLRVSIGMDTAPILTLPDRLVRTGFNVASTKRVENVTDADTPIGTSVKSSTSDPWTTATKRPFDRATSAISSELVLGILMKNGLAA